MMVRFFVSLRKETGGAAREGYGLEDVFKEADRILAR